MLVCALVIGLLPLHGVANAEWGGTDVQFESDESAGWGSGDSKTTPEITEKYQGGTSEKKAIPNYMYEKLGIRSADTGVNIDKEMNLYPGMKLDWKAFAFDKAGNTENDVTTDASWRSSNPSVVEVDKGKLSLKDKGEAKITVKHKGLTSNIKIKVEPPCKELTLSPGKLIEFKFGDKAINVTAKAKMKDGNLENVTDKADWSTSDSDVVEVKDGAVKPIGVGTATITATYLGVTKSVTAVVRPSYKAMRISPDKQQTMFLDSEPLNVQTFVLNSEGEQEEVTHLTEWHLAEWTSNHAVTVHQGQFYAKRAGTATVTAKYKGLSKSISVKVISADNVRRLDWPEEDNTDNGGIRKMDIYMEDSQSLPKVEAILRLGIENVDVSDLAEWQSSNTGVISIEDGKMKAESRGTAILTATVRNHTISMEVTVKRKAPILQTYTGKMNIVAGREQPVPDVTAIYMNGDEENITSEMKWESSSPNLLVVDGKLKGLVPGTAMLIGTYDNVKISVKVTIKVTIEEEVVRFEIEPGKLALDLKKSQRIKVTGYYKNGKKISLGSKVDWKSANEKIATVKGTSVKGVAIGSTRLVGEFQGQKLEVPVIVEPKLTKQIAESNSVKLTIGQEAVEDVEEKLVRFEIEPGQLTLNLKKSQSIKVTGYYKNGKKVSLESKVKWYSGNEKVAMVKGASVKGVAIGSTMLVGVFQGQKLEVPVTVVPKVMKLIAEPNSEKLTVGEEAYWKVKAIYDTGEAVNVTFSVTFVPSNANVKVERGRVKGVSKGSTSVKLTFGGKSTSMRISVK
ncbi:bacterial surface protein [Paenibacillus popilliae ATCC 14706]|uniref:Bacterial surface protein n=2 Tax=Paenibacillus popilliae TaxID=78057 RepID=M9LKH4_PAEPP|nr:bacterial surface protein [Paenibacillus popilliae ATCC 14706]